MIENTVGYLVIVVVLQIGKGKWEGDWRANSGCLQAQKKRDGVLRWMDAYMDYGMILDIPAWVDRFQLSRG